MAIQCYGFFKKNVFGGVVLGVLNLMFFGASRGGKAVPICLNS